VQDTKLALTRDARQLRRDRHCSYHRELNWASNLARLSWWSAMKAALKVLHRLSIHGREHLPADPSFVMVSNHASHLDALVLGAALPLRLRNQLYPLAAGDVFFETPRMAAFSATFLNALPVWRKNFGAHAVKELRGLLLDQPSIFIFFPEGGRTRDGLMREFRAGVGMLTAETSVPVIPCYVSGTFEAFPPYSRFPRPRKVSVHIGQPRVFTGVDNRRSGWEHIRATIEADVRALGEAAGAGRNVPPPGRRERLAAQWRY
jgi:1-acyl-sn-glycerol-3-phosphate acyltransferase